METNMRLVTFILETTGGIDRGPAVGALLNGGEQVLDFAAALADFKDDRSIDPVLRWLDVERKWFGRARALFDEVEGNPARLEELHEKGSVHTIGETKLLAPVPRPGKLICIGLNYRDHAAESNMPIPERPVVFSKFTNAVIGQGQPVVLPATSTQVDYEAELAVVIGRKAKNVSPERAFDYVLGYTNLNDVSARDFQFADGQWQRGKSCDTFAPMGPYIATTDEVPDPHILQIMLRLNGKTMQNSKTDQLIFGVPELIAFLSETITLEPGDVIATGTPPGVGFARRPPVFLKAGDLMEVEIEGLGVLSNPLI
jgi:2-keto-4-pentenoate hydratase/2-oxohepta-3-ene-1,7-dioic acid hydratase in catechol pathway